MKSPEQIASEVVAWYLQLAATLGHDPERFLAQLLQEEFGLPRSRGRSGRTSPHEAHSVRYQEAGRG